MTARIILQGIAVVILGGITVWLGLPDITPIIGAGIVLIILGIISTGVRLLTAY